jgi:RNA polymerase sigma-70 factor (ECF subfamily)
MQNEQQELFLKYKNNPKHELLIALLQSLQPNIYSVSFRVLKNDADCQDVIQEVMVKLIRSLHLLENVENILGWVHRISFNSALEFKRKNLKHQILNQEISVADQSDSFDNNSYVLHEHIGNLDNESKQLILLRFFDNKTYEEIVTITGKAYATIHRDIKIILGNLKKSLEKSGYFSIALTFEKILEENVQIPQNSFVMNEVLNIEINKSLQFDIKKSNFIPSALSITAISLIIYSLIVVTPFFQEKELPLKAKAKETIQSTINSEGVLKTSKQSTENFLKTIAETAPSKAESIRSEESKKTENTESIVKSSKQQPVIRCRVLDQENQQGVPKAQIKAYNVSLKKNRLLISDENGYFEYSYENSKAVMVQFNISHPDFAGKEIVIAKNNAETNNIYLNKGTTLTGRFLEVSTQIPIKNYKLTLIPVTCQIEFAKSDIILNKLVYEKIPEDNKIYTSINVDDKLGEFVIKNVPEGLYLLMFQGDNFINYYYDGRSNWNKYFGLKISGLTQELSNIYLPKQGNIKIQCVDNITQNPLNNVEISLPFDKQSSLKKYYTDQNGQCLIPVSIGTDELIVEDLKLFNREGYYPCFEGTQFFESEDGSMSNTNFALRKKIFFESKAKSLSGEIIPFAIIRIRNFSNEFIAFANENGEYDFSLPGDMADEPVVIDVWNLSGEIMMVKFLESLYTENETVDLNTNIIGKIELFEGENDFVSVNYLNRIIPITDESKFVLANISPRNNVIEICFENSNASYSLFKSIFISSSEPIVDLNIQFTKSITVNFNVEKNDLEKYDSEEYQDKEFYFELSSLNDKTIKISGKVLDIKKPLQLVVPIFCEFNLKVISSSRNHNNVEDLYGYDILKDFGSPIEFKLNRKKKSSIKIIIRDKDTKKIIPDVTFRYHLDDRYIIGGSDQSGLVVSTESFTSDTPDIPEFYLINSRAKIEYFKAPNYVTSFDEINLDLIRTDEIIVYLQKSNALQITFVKKNSIASRSGLRKGDFILRVGDKRVLGNKDFLLAQKEYMNSPGNIIQILRNKETLNIALSKGNLGVEFEGVYEKSILDE